MNGMQGKIAWFEGNTTNVCYNCVDRHVEAPRPDMTRLREENAQHFQCPRTDTMVSRNGRN